MGCKDRDNNKHKLIFSSTAKVIRNELKRTSMIRETTYIYVKSSKIYFDRCKEVRKWEPTTAANDPKRRESGSILPLLMILRGEEVAAYYPC